jgi:hypothetical protein
MVDFTPIQHLSPEWHCFVDVCVDLSVWGHTVLMVGSVCSFVFPQSIFGKLQPFVMHYKMPFTKFCAYENCIILGYYTASSGNLLPVFWDNLFVPSLLRRGHTILTSHEDRVSPPLTSEDGIGMLSRNVGKKLYHYWLCNNPEQCSSHMHRITTTDCTITWKSVVLIYFASQARNHFYTSITFI